MPVIWPVSRSWSSAISRPAARIAASPSDADAHAPDDVLNSDASRPKLAGCPKPARDVLLRACRGPGIPDVGAAPADVERKGEASPCSTMGTAEVSCDSTVGVLVAADVPVAWASAAAWPPSRPGLVLCGGGVNGVSIVADADTTA